MENNPQPPSWPPQQPTPPQSPAPPAGPPQQPAQPGFETQPQPPVQPAQQPASPSFEVQQSTPEPSAANQYIPEGMSSYDYLDTISATPNKVLGFTTKQLLIAAISLILVIGFAVILGVINSAGPNTTKQSYTLLARSKSLSEVTKESQPNLNSRELVPLNSSLTAQLKTTHSELQKSFTESGLNAGKIPKDVLAAENNEELLAKLEDAKLSGTFDRVYTREMVYHLQTLILALESLENTTKDQSQKAQLKDLASNLSELHKQLDDYVDS